MHEPEEGTWPRAQSFVPGLCTQLAPSPGCAVTLAAHIRPRPQGSVLSRGLLRGPGAQCWVTRCPWEPAGWHARVGVPGSGWAAGKRGLCLDLLGAGRGAVGTARGSR